MASDYDQIRADNIREYGEGTRHLAFLNQLYADRTHFVYELLQNAEDARASRVFFRLHDDRLEVMHNGRLFDDRDVRGICGVVAGTKGDDLTQIGKFGIGFKSVYAYTTKPEVHCGDEHFRIESYVRPHRAESRVAGEGWTTLFILPFDKPGLARRKVSTQISDRLCDLGVRTLLFLRRIEEISYELPDGAWGTYLREERPRDRARQVTLIGQSDAGTEDEEWLLFERLARLPEKAQRVRVEVAFRLERDPKTEIEAIKRISSAPLVVFFPTEKDTRLGFLIQGPYRTTPARDNVPADDPSNRTLIAETAALVCESTKSLKTMGLASISLLEALPIRRDEFPEWGMFTPIADAVRDLLKHEALLPTDTGSHVSAQNARLASAAWLREILREAQLGQLYGSQGTLRWVSGEVTQRARPDLWRYLRDHLGIEELTPVSFARKADEAFYAAQTDEWLMRYYGLLNEQRALWRNSDYLGVAGPLRHQPILRLQDGSHVAPFDENDHPRAYLASDEDLHTSLPVVKLALTRDEGAARFLTALGIPKLDKVAEVIERILPKYQSEVSIDEHLRDMDRILQAYQTDSRKGQGKLQERLESTPFVLVEAWDRGHERFCLPAEAYFRSSELEIYYQGNEEIGFASDRYTKAMREMLKALGVSSAVRVHREAPNSQGFVIIADMHSWHQRAVGGFDPGIRVEGLEHAIANPTVDKSAFIWNSIARPHSACIAGTVQTSTKQNYQNSRSETRVSSFGQTLRESRWLPRKDGSFAKPSELVLDDLLASFERNQQLAIQLGMESDVLTQLAAEAGLDPQLLALAKQHAIEFRAWATKLSAQDTKPAFPVRASADPDRRQARLDDEYAVAARREYEIRERSVRASRGTVDPHGYLRSNYTNEKEQLICQICKDVMPFRKRTGEYYFEAVEVLPGHLLPHEEEEQFLALCPVCAAMYWEFVKKDEAALERFRSAVLTAQNCEIPVELGDLYTSVRFVEKHFLDLKTILTSEDEDPL